MIDPELRAQLERHWEYSGRDENIAHEIYADDAVLEFPQGNERYEGTSKTFAGGADSTQPNLSSRFAG
ncbi:hypothetical protein BH23ACT5_BH23ACT5_18570 [soil metagenome]